jgi:hypothetical protein
MPKPRKIVNKAATAVRLLNRFLIQQKFSRNEPGTGRQLFSGSALNHFLRLSQFPDTDSEARFRCK